MYWRLLDGQKKRAKRCERKEGCREKINKNMKVEKVRNGTCHELDRFI